MIIRNICNIAGVIIINSIFDHIVWTGHLYIGGGILLMSMIGILYYLHRSGASMGTLGGLLVFFFYITMYSTVRLSVSVFKPTLQSIFRMDDVYYTYFTSIFSFAYGLSQMLGGYLLAKYQFNVIKWFLGILIGFLCTFPLLDNVHVALVYRFFFGILYSVSCIGFSYFVKTNFAPDMVSFLSLFGIFFCFKIAAYTNDVIIVSGLSMSSLFYFFGLLTIFSLIISLFSFKLPATYNSSFQSSEKISNTTILLLCTYALFSVIIMYILQDGWLNVIQKANLPLLQDGFFTSRLNNICSLSSLVFPFLLNITKEVTLMCFAASLQVMGCILLFYPSISRFFGLDTLTTLYILIFGVALGGKSHILPQLYILKRAGQSTGALLGVLNFFSMLLGCFGGQFGFGLLGQIFFGKGNLFTVHEVLFLLKCFMIGPLLALVASILMQRREKSTC